MLCREPQQWCIRTQPADPDLQKRDERERGQQGRRNIPQDALHRHVMDLRTPEPSPTAPVSVHHSGSISHACFQYSPLLHVAQQRPEDWLNKTGRRVLHRAHGSVGEGAKVRDLADDKQEQLQHKQLHELRRRDDCSAYDCHIRT